MKVQTISMPKEKAQKAWAEYSQTLKERKDQYIKDTTKALSFLRRGKKILDITELLKNIPLKNGLPAIAIAPAYLEVLYLNHYCKGEGRFCKDSNRWWNIYTFKLEEFTRKDNNDYRIYSTLVPCIPPKYLPKGNLKTGGYYLLWEVESWKKEPPKDPILLKRISKNLFAILASWNLSPLERAVLNGRI
mgnify:CR=1 FL=1